VTPRTGRFHRLHSRRAKRRICTIAEEWLAAPVMRRLYDASRPI